MIRRGAKYEVTWNCKEDCKVEEQELESSPLKARFLSTGITDIWGWIILYCGVCPVHCSMFSSTPCLYPLVAPSSCGNKKCLQTLTQVSWGA